MLTIIIEIAPPGKEMQNNKKNPTKKSPKHITEGGYRNCFSQIERINSKQF